jgi:hypothetical protein
VAGRASLSLHCPGERALLIQESYGGTQTANRYLGLARDVPIRVYTLPWAPKHDWTSFVVSSEADQTTCRWDGEGVRFERICPVQDDGQGSCME